MIQSAPRVWAQRPPTVPAQTGTWAWVIRHGFWIVLLVIVTVWELIGLFFPVWRKTPEWWDHPSISQEVKNLIGTSLPGRIIGSVVITALSVVLTLHWAWRIPG